MTLPDVSFEQPVIRRDVEDLGPAVASRWMTPDELRSVLDAAPEVVRRLEEDDRWWSDFDDWTPVES
jgi:hypothetical protein